LNIVVVLPLADKMSPAPGAGGAIFRVPEATSRGWCRRRRLAQAQVAAVHR